MLGIMVRKEDAEKVRHYLKQQSLLELDRKIFSKNNFIYIPLPQPEANEEKALGETGLQDRVREIRSAIREEPGTYTPR